MELIKKGISKEIIDEVRRKKEWKIFSALVGDGISR